MKKARNQISKSQRKDTILQICKLAQLQIWANIRNRIKTSFVPYKISSCWLRIAIAAAATFIHTCAHNCTQETENTKMSDAAHRLLDNLVNDLKTKLLAKTHEDIVVELEKRERALQIMVEEMLAEHKAHMLEVFLDKVPLFSATLYMSLHIFARILLFLSEPNSFHILRTSPPPPSLSLLSESISPILLFSRLFSALRSRISSSFWSALTDETDV